MNFFLKSLIILYLFFFSKSFAVGVLDKEFFITCKGTWVSKSGYEDFFQDIKISFFREQARPGGYIYYEIIATDKPAFRPTMFNSPDVSFDKKTAQSFMKTFESIGVGVVKLGWQDGVIEVYSPKGKEFDKKLKAKITRHTEILNLNNNSLTIRVEFDLKDEKFDLVMSGRAGCNKNTELMNYTKSFTIENLKKSKNGIFKKTLGNILGK